MYQINDRCRACGFCATLCPAGAIGLGRRHYEIDPDKCRACGVCQSRCPRNAIVTVSGERTASQSK